MNFPFTKFRKIYYIFSAILILGSVASLILFGLKPGIEFTGGSILELEFKKETLSNQEIRDKLTDFDLGEIQVQSTEKGVILRTKEISEDIHQKILERLAKNDIQELRFESIGPTIGEELTAKTRIAIILALLAITIYIAFAFRKISRPMASWQYSIAALLALFHDVLIPVGVFAVLGKFYNTEFTIPIIAALLTILGYSINDTVVIFDRIRENLLRRTTEDYEGTVNKSLNQTLRRSVNTVLTVLIVLTAIFLFGGDTLKSFSLALIVGIASGAYSSIFIASPILVSWFKFKQRKFA